jgi:hypothetical protein
MVSHGVPWCPISTASRSTEALGLKDLLFRDTLELKNTSAQGDTLWHIVTETQAAYSNSHV